MVDHLSPEQIAGMSSINEPDPTPEPEVPEAPAPEGAAPEEGEAPASEGVATPPPAQETVADPYEAFGGESRVRDAVAIAEALGTDEGVEALVREGLAALGLDPDAAFSLAKGEEPPDPDALMTRAEFEAEMKKQSQTFAQQQRAQAEVVARGAVEGTLEELGVSDDEDARRMVLTYAQNHVSGPDEIDPRKLVEAVQKGHADYVAAMERAAAAYVEKRKKTNESVPAPLRGGGAPAGTEAEPPKPKNMEEARAAVRRAMPGAFARD